METMVRAGGLQGYVALMLSLGSDPKPLLRRHGLSAARLADEDALVPLDAALDLLEDSARQTGHDDFGLRLARAQDISMLGPLALAMQHCATVADALDCVSRYLFVHSPGIALSVRRPGMHGAGSADLRYDITAPGKDYPRQGYDIGLGVAHHVLMLLAGARYRLHAVSVPYEADGPLLTHARYFGVEIRRGQPCCALHMDASSLEAPVRSANPALLRIATDYLAAHFPGPAHRLAPRVQLALSSALGHTTADKTAIAAMLALHPRTLQRQLDQEGTSFEALRDDVRRRHAERYLTRTRLPLAQVAGLLGFSQQSALTRYCRQSFGMTPRALRDSGAAQSRIP